jgi:hypothetical protein
MITLRSHAALFLTFLVTAPVGPDRALPPLPPHPGPESECPSLQPASITQSHPEFTSIRKMEAAQSSEKFVPTRWTRRCHNPENVETII